MVSRKAQGSSGARSIEESYDSDGNLRNIGEAMAMGLGRRLVVETSEEAQGCGGDWSPGSPMMKRGQTEHPRAGRARLAKES